MENFRDFLESSTIHGLNYILTATKYVRLFWILVVIAGFTGAAFLIQTSFQNWSDSPITTTTEILPISQITFPKVTVCPPKETYTDLNIVLDMMNNMTLDNYTINNISKFAVDLIIDNLNNTIIRNLSLFKEEMQFYNWYYGYTELRLPFISSPWYDNDIAYVINTYATTGSITTQYFGEKFDVDKLELDINYKLRLMVPDSIISNPNALIHFTIEKVTMQNLKRGRDNLFVGGLNFNDYNEFKASRKPFTRKYLDDKCQCYEIFLNRKVSKEDVVSSVKLDQMPGWNISWYYTGLGKAEFLDQIEKSSTNHQFVR